MYSIIGNQFKKPSGILGVFISRMMEKGNAKLYQRLFEDIDLREGDRVLEIGFGPGHGIEYLTDNNNTVLVDGIDYSKLMYNKAFKKFLPKINQGFVNLYYGDFAKGHIPKKYDLIFCVNVIYFWNKLSEPFLKVKSMLKPGGTFAFYMADREELDKLAFTKEHIFKKYSIDEVSCFLTELGFHYRYKRLEHGYLVRAWL